MNIVINGSKKDITPISQLSFDQFNKIIVDKEVFDLKEYISLFIDMPIADLMNAEIRSVSMPALHASIFDVDIKKTIKDTPITFNFDGDIYLTKDITLSTFGQNYMFDLYFENYKSGKINIYEISLYALACHITKSHDMSIVDSIYNQIKQMNWRECLPQAFFLVKKFLKKKKGSLRLSIFYTVELNRMRLLSSYRMSKRVNSVRRLFPKRYAKLQIAK